MKTILASEEATPSSAFRSPLNVSLPMPWQATGSGNGKENRKPLQAGQDKDMVLTDRVLKYSTCDLSLFQLQVVMLKLFNYSIYLFKMDPTGFNENAGRSDIQTQKNRTVLFIKIIADILSVGRSSRLTKAASTSSSRIMLCCGATLSR